MNNPKLRLQLSKENDRIMQFDPNQDIRCHPKVHYGINTYLIEMRQELYRIGQLNMKVRREKLWNLLRSDFLEEDVELRHVDLAYINTQL